MCSDDADDQSDSGNRQCHRDHFLQRKLLLASCNYIEEYPHRRGVLHDDGGGDVSSLDRDVIEIIRDGDAKGAQNEAINEIARGQLDALPTFRSNQEGKQYEQGECGAGLRKNERIDGTKRCEEGQASGEGGAAQGGGNSPKKSGGGDEEIAAQRMRERALSICLRDGEPRESFR